MAGYFMEIFLKEEKENIQLSTLMLLHLKALKLDNIEQYIHWCNKNGFDSSLNKTPEQLAFEMQYRKTEWFNLSLSGKKGIKKNIPSVIKQIYTQSIKADRLFDPRLKRISIGFSECGDEQCRKIFFLYLKTILKKSEKIFSDAIFIKALVNIFNFRQYWIRDYKEWKPKSHNPYKHIASLSRHLFAQYNDVPAFMDQVWFENNTVEQKWYIHLARGHNFRTAENLPVPLTKKMAHYFMKAPKDYSIPDAIRWGQVHSLGAKKLMVEALRKTKLNDDFDNNEFKMSIIRFFIENPMLDKAHYRTIIIDYIWNQKFENSFEVSNNGKRESVGPEQPNFRMKGRSVESLLKQIEKSRVYFGRIHTPCTLQWEKSIIKDFKFAEGSKEQGDYKLWTIVELLTKSELNKEGHLLKHCVGTYANSCFKGSSTIWTMECEDLTKKKKLLTIELDPNSLSIVQVRGKRNRLAKQEELKIIEIWAKKESLTISKAVYKI